jgi:1,4-alpha-glucan branching enzyme
MGLCVHDGLAREEVVTALVSAEGGAVLNPAGTGAQPTAQWRRGPVGTGPCRILSVEQSNTSVVLGDGVLVKFFRLLSPGINPDIEVHAGLAEVGCVDVGELLGWLNGGWIDPASGQTVFGHLAMIQEFFPGSIDGWDLARERVAAGDDFMQESFDLGTTTARVHHDLAVAFGVTDLQDAAIPAMSRRLHTRLSAAGELVVGGTRPGAGAAHTPRPGG